METTYNKDSIPPGFWIGLILIAIILIIRNCVIK